MLALSLGLSLHLGLVVDYNEVHPHVRYSNDIYISGIYYNSEGRVSTYAGYRIEHGDWGLELAAVSGYSAALIVPYTRITYKNLFIAPAFEKRNNGVVIGFEIPL